MGAIFGAALLAVSSWPQFRGPQSNPVGENPRLPENWSKTENIAWMAEIPGRGWSSPIVTGGKVFLTTVVTEAKVCHETSGSSHWRPRQDAVVPFAVEGVALNDEGGDLLVGNLESGRITIGINLGAYL